MPVARTSPLPLPETTEVPLKTMFLGNACSSPVSCFASKDLVCSVGSPVSVASFVCKSTTSFRIMSAGTISPILIKTMSPMTKSCNSTSVGLPSRMATTASLPICSRSAAPGSCPEYSPTAFVKQTKPTMQMSTYAFTSSPMANERHAATNVSKKMIFLICVTKMEKKESVPAASRTFGPSSFNRRAASSDERPSASEKVP
mmetsp:Transcript_80887/g.232401  ORF Transcript_80887/g.232401 Transcript_80887/m.232401 type:complete len:201 (-) Transcript_80887:97-699(-)